MKKRSEPVRLGIRERLVFLQEFIKNPRQVASIVPSSRFVERRIIKFAEIRSARTIVELGTGTGGTTRAILNAMLPEAQLLSLEINAHFCALVRRIQDPRLIVHCGSACDLQEILQCYELSAPEAVVSGIPFSTMTGNMAQSILQAISTALPLGGRFVAYQVSSHVHEISRPVLGTARVEVELCNIPPLRLYRWDKTAGW